MSLVRKLLGLLRRRLLQDAMYVTASEFVTAVCSFLLSVLLARSLGQQDFGRYGYINTWLAVVSIFSLPGMDAAVNAAVARGAEGTFTAAARQKLRFSLLGSVALLGGAGYLALQGDTRTALGLAAAALFFHGYYSTLHERYVMGKQQYRRLLTMRLVSNLAPIALAGLTALLLPYFVPVMSVFFGSTAVINWLFTWRYAHRSAGARVEEQAISFGLSLSWIGVIGVVANSLDRFLVQGRLGYEELAAYMVIMALPNQLRRAFSVVNALLFPKVAQRSLRDVLLMLRRRIWLAVGALVLATAVAAAVIPWLIPLVYGPAYQGTVWYSELFLLVPLLVMLYTPFTKVLFPAHNRAREITKLTLCEAVLDVIGFAILIPRLGLLGAIIAQIISATAVLVYAWVLAHRIVATEAV